MTVFRLSYENTIFTKSAPLSSRFLVFDVYAQTGSEKYQKRMLFDRFILGHFGTSSPHLDRTCRDLGSGRMWCEGDAPIFEDVSREVLILVDLDVCGARGTRRFLRMSRARS